MTLVCWVRRTWLRRRFTRQRRMRLRAFCRGTSAYAVLVRGAHQPPPTPTDISSDPKVLRHPFRDRGQPLPQRWRARRIKRPRRRPGRRHRPRAPDCGGGPPCMPLCFWAAQTSVVALDASVGTGTPHTATIEIQRACQPHVVDRMLDGLVSDDHKTARSSSLPMTCLHLRRGSVLAHCCRGSVLGTSWLRILGPVIWTMGKRVGCPGRPVS